MILLSRTIMVVIAMGAVAALLSCGGANRNSPSGLPSPEGAITGFHPTNAGVSYAFYALDDIAARQPTELRAAAIKHLSDRDVRVHYAAVYALAITVEPGQGTQQLASLLGAANADDRLLAAASLSGIGDKRGLPVLIAALDNDQGLSYRSPPQRAFEFARVWLLNLTDQDFGLKAAQDEPSVAATKPAWRQWWVANQVNLRFDTRRRIYM